MTKYTNRIAYLCPSCGDELNKGATCPNCKCKAKLFDLSQDYIEQERVFDEHQERDFCDTQA